jgi:hypothetical protein
VVLRQRLELERAIASAADRVSRSTAVVEAGLLHGYPQCCVKAYACSDFAGLGLRGWATLAVRSALPGRIPGYLHPLLVPALGFVPCSAACPLAEAQHRSLFELLDVAPALDSANVHLVSLDAQTDGELLILPNVTVAGSTVHYHPSATTSGCAELADRIRRGDRLELVAGQIRIMQAADLVDLLTVSHALWSAERCWHAQEWCELGAGAAFAACQASDPGAPTQEDRQAVATRPVLRLLMRQRCTPGEYAFQLTNHQVDRPAFRRVGQLALSYEPGALTPASKSFVRVLLQAMHALAARPLGPACLPEWQRTLARLAERSGLGQRFEWRLTWQDGRQADAD